VIYLTLEFARGCYLRPAVGARNAHVTEQEFTEQEFTEQEFTEQEFTEQEFTEQEFAAA
jgi:hypothetical protein